MTRLRTSLALVLILAVTGCASAGPAVDKSQVVAAEALIVSGESLEQAGLAFRKTAEGYKKGCDGTPRTFTPAQCKTFKEFEHTFKPNYDKAITGWRAAKKAGDVALQTSWAAVITKLSTEALPFAAAAIAAFGGK